MQFSVVILAAGQSKRMRSQLPKVLHSLGGKPLLAHILQAVQTLNIDHSPIVVYGHAGEQVQAAFHHTPLTWIKQKEQLGTGHALLQALSAIPAHHRVLVLCGDTPLISSATLQQFITETPENALGIITANLTHPKGFGRIIRDAQLQIIKVVEEKDATHTEINLTEINTGIYFIPSQYLTSWLSQLTNHNAQKEYYLTDIIQLAYAANVPIYSVQPRKPYEILGVNDRVQLAELERLYQQREAENLMRQGVTLLDPARFDLRGELTAGQDVIIDVNVIIEGKVKLGDGCRIGPHCILRNTTIGDRTEIKANTMIDDAVIAADCTIGPFARLRPGTELDPEVHIGNFVEIKKSKIGTQTKINHLSYIGDSEVGCRVNIGAGTITCNYDGVSKHKTIIGNDVFIGSHTQMVAPIHIAEGATIGAGSTITRDAPPHQLTVARARQRSIENWQRPQRKEKP